MDLVIGDSAIDVPVQWALGTVAVSHQGGDDSSQSSLTAINALFQPKPEIVHIQRTPGRRPHSVVSVLFTALALAPLGLLYVMLSSLGANIKVSHCIGAASSCKYSAQMCCICLVSVHILCKKLEWATCITSRQQLVCLCEGSTSSCIVSLWLVHSSILAQTTAQLPCDAAGLPQECHCACCCSGLS